MLEAASRLFETLHELDRLNIKKIHAQYAPEESLGIAINDRLRRAAAK
jgi:L-threonylcarbamoyladenylate synthase